MPYTGPRIYGSSRLLAINVSFRSRFALDLVGAIVFRLRLLARRWRRVLRRLSMLQIRKSIYPRTEFQCINRNRFIFKKIRLKRTFSILN